ncbi:MAG: hypothetical protein RL368_2124 [Pseudomonadota bacterium]|jgi:hypothetical protein
MNKVFAFFACLLFAMSSANSADTSSSDLAAKALVDHPTVANAEVYLAARNDRLAKIRSVNAAIEAEFYRQNIGPVWGPGIIGDAKLLVGVVFSADVAQLETAVVMGNVRFGGIAYPDRASLRVLVKVTSMSTISKDGVATFQEVDGYLEDKDGKPGLLSAFSLKDNSLTLESGANGRVVLLRSVTSK